MSIPRPMLFTAAFVCYLAQFTLFLALTDAFYFSTAQTKTRLARARLALEATKWTSAVSANQDLNVAMQETLQQLAKDHESPRLALFFVSSVYENSGFAYETIFKELRSTFPNLQAAIGCTTVCAIGPGDSSSLKPIEIESRSSISVSALSLADDVDMSVFSIGTPEMKAYVNDVGRAKLPFLLGGGGDASGSTDGGVGFILATEKCTSVMPNFMQQLVDRKDIATIFGGMASCVTTLQLPKVFLYTSNAKGTFEKVTKGAVGVKLTGNIEVCTAVAHSCLPVGSMYEVLEVDPSNPCEILNLRKKGASKDADLTPPLVALGDVLEEIPVELSYNLKRELLVGMASDSPAGLDSLPAAEDYFVQKPLTFDPMSGSMTVTCLPGDMGAGKGKNDAASCLGATFQFCVQENAASRADLSKAVNSIKSALGSKDPLALLLLGSSDRGNKMFRYDSWESNQLYQALSEAGLEQRVPITGFFSAASFCSEPAAIMKTDSVYALLTSKKSSSGSPDAAFSSSTSASAAILVDVLTDTERQMYDDFEGEFSGVIVRKRDPEAAPPVRVASMDYLVPEKQPNPSNFLESLVWDREKDVNRMREALQLARAISQAKLAGVRFPQRSLATAVHDMKTKLSLLSAGGSAGRIVSPVLVEIMRSSVNYGRAPDSASPAFLQSALKSLQSIPSVVSVGCHVDLKNFGGKFEDVEALRTSTPETLPVFCNDFILYGYQIFTAKAAGADVIKLMAAILSSQEVTYFIKIAKTLGMSCVVVVASKVQALDVLANVAGLEAMSVTSRNMRIWKTDPGKAEKILGDSDVQAAIKAKQLEQPFLLMQEGFSSPEEVLRAGQNGVDAVFLSEELLVNQKPIADAVNSWIGL